MPAPISERSAWLGFALVAAAAASWGAQSVVAKLLLTSGLAPSQLVSARTGAATALVAAALAVLDRRLFRISTRQARHLAALGVVGMALSQYAYYVALARMPVAMTLLVIYTSPLFVLAASLLLYGEPVRPRDVSAAVTTLVGAALVVRADDPGALRLNTGGLAAAVLSAIGFAFYSLWGKRAAPGVSPWTMLVYSMGSALAFWLPVVPPWGFFLTFHPPGVWAGFAVVVVFGTLVPFGLYLAALKRISATHASVTSTLEPVVAATVAFFVLGESLGGFQLLGAALVLVGIALLHAR